MRNVTNEIFCGNAKLDLNAYLHVSHKQADALKYEFWQETTEDIIQGTLTEEEGSVQLFVER